VGLPWAAIDRLSTPRSAQGVAHLLRAQRWLDDESGALADVLHETIGRGLDAAAKPAVVGLRRAVHRQRRPAGSEWHDGVAAALPGPVADRVRTWVAALSDRHRRRQELADVLVAETAALRPVLREVAADPGFRLALAQSSPALHAELAKWLTDPARVPRRQVQVRLVQYLVRAATRTSPFSTYTTVGVGTWTPAGPAVRLTTRPAATGVLELSDLYGVIEAVCRRPHLQERLPLRINPSLTRDGDALVFVAGRPSERIVTMAAAPAVRRVLHLLGEKGVSTRNEAVERLVALGGAGADAERFLAGLVEAGLLERWIPVPDQAADPLGDLSDWLAAQGEDADVVVLVDRVRALLRHRVPLDDPDGHGRHLGALQRAVGALADRVGLPADRRTGRVVHETTVFTAPVAECALPPWRAVAEDLDTVRALLGIVDPALPLRLALARYHAERFGPGTRVPFVVLHRAVVCAVTEARNGGGGAAVQELAAVLLGSASAPGTSLAGFASPRFRRLDELRREARDALRRSTAPDGAVHVPAGVVAELRGSWPSWIVAPASVGYYVQVCHPDGDPAVVVNAAHTGWGRGRSRALRLVSDGAGGGGAGGDGADADGVRVAGSVGDGVTAELPAALGLTMNRRFPSTSLDIEYPSAVSARPVGQRIRVGDLAVAHDPATDLLHLVSCPDGFRVSALHLGMLADVLLPPLARLLTQAFGGTYYMHPMMPVLASEADLRTPTTVVRWPRVTVGRVVVQRARWEAPADLVPVRRRGEDDADLLLRLRGWLERHGVPSRFYLRVVDEHLRAAPGDAAGWRALAGASYKPTYVDVDNWWSVQVLERVLRAPSGVVVFEEALPAPDDAPADPTGEGRVTELLLEVGGEFPRG
jgi:hypothetical protein